MKQEIVKKFGERVRLIRNELKLSQKEFAAKIGVASSYISELESGKTGAGFDFMYKVSLHYNINPFYLFHGRGPRFLSAEFEMVAAQPLEPLLEDEKVRELFYWIQHSELFRYAILLFAKQYLIENKGLLKKESVHVPEVPPGFNLD